MAAGPRLADPKESIVEVVLFATLVLSVVDGLREITNWSTHRASFVNRLCSWVAGVLVVWLGSAATVTDAVTLPGVDQPLGSFTGGDIVLVGLLVAGLANTIVTVKQAVDGSDSAAKPNIVR